MSEVGVVAIGRNEGERLRACLASVLANAQRVVYVDSGSSDGSVAMARAMGAEVVELDTRIPFCAARARNEGLARLLAVAPASEFVYFIDGDCTIIDGWMPAALAEMHAHAKAAVVCGHRREMHPEASIYNRLADVEWAGGVGDVDSCGGDALMRIAAFNAVGGFDPSVPAGEEPELCLRLRNAGWKIRRLDQGMTWHDSAMTRIGQWWKRQVRTGYAGLDVARRFRHAGFIRQTKSARMWTLGVVTLAVALAIVGAFMHGWLGAAIGLIAGLALMPLQAIRIAAKKRRLGARIALAYGAMTMLSKWGQLSGQVRYLRARLRGRSAQLIEYKGPAAQGAKASHGS